MNFSRKSITAVLLVVISIVLGYFLVWPKWNDYKLTKASLADALAAQEQLKKGQQDLNAFLAEYNQHSNDATRVNQALPLSETQLHNVLNDLDTITKASGITLGQFSILDTQGSDNLGAATYSIQSLDLSLTGSGTYSSFRNFIGSLENNLRIMDIKNATLSAGEGTQVQFNLEFRTYYQK
jgi:Tfp pilus assembly protein PilO